MKIIPTKLSGVFVIEPVSFQDERGSFVKTFNKDLFEKFGLETDFKESFCSVSKKDTIRGMHFHHPPKEHAKLVYVTRGSLLDVVLDLRKNSPTYGKCVTVHLTEENKSMIYISPGFAHGFLSLEDDTTTVYLQTGVYSQEHDDGIHFDSFGMEWQVKNPIVSKRDQSFRTMDTFNSPFA